MTSQTYHCIVHAPWLVITMDVQAVTELGARAACRSNLRFYGWGRVAENVKIDAVPVGGLK